jgi:hypothetical protein
MRDAALPPLQNPVMPFSEFLAALFQAFAREGLRACVLRNFEGYPNTNYGNDMDILILQSELPCAIRALGSLEGIRIVGYCEREFATCVFLEGASSTPGSRSIQVDLFWSLSSKGPLYLGTAAVLQAANSRQAGDLNFLAPSEVHQAIISLLASLLHGGAVKEKYFPQVQRTFASHRLETIGALQPRFGLKTAARLTDAVIDGDRQRILDCRRRLRVAVTLRSLLHEPLGGALAIVRYYACEVVVRFSPKNLETVCILGLRGCCKAATIEELMPMLHSLAQTVERCDLRPGLPIAGDTSGASPRPDLRTGSASGRWVSMAKAVLLLGKEWLNQFTGRRNLTLRIRASCYHDLLIDPKRYRYGGPMWFARLIAKLIPPPDLWILLDQSTESLRSRGPDPPPPEALTQIEAYRAFVTTRRRYVILAASQPADRVAESAYAAIIDTLAQRADRTLKRRF